MVGHQHPRPRGAAVPALTAAQGAGGARGRVHREARLTGEGLASAQGSMAGLMFIYCFIGDISNISIVNGVYKPIYDV